MTEVQAMTMKDAKIPILDAQGLRSFGLITGAIVAALFGVAFPFVWGFSWPFWPWVVFAILAIWAIVHPTSLNPVYRGWMRIGMLVGKVTTPIVLTLAFVIAILPGAIVMRIVGKDPMRRRFDRDESYRVKSKQPKIKNMDKPY